MGVIFLGKTVLGKHRTVAFDRSNLPLLHKNNKTHLVGVGIVVGGGCEIRTHGGFDPITGFQDQLHKPLGQTSAFGAIFNFLRNVVRIAVPQKA